MSSVEDNKELTNFHSGPYFILETVIAVDEFVSIVFGILDLLAYVL